MKDTRALFSSNLARSSRANAVSIQYLVGKHKHASHVDALLRARKRYASNRPLLKLPRVVIDIARAVSVSGDVIDSIAST